MISTESEARALCAQLVDSAGLKRLEIFAAMLEEENTRQNLVSAGSLPHIWQRHIADSLQLLAYVSRETGPWLDLGTGAGFPGMLIALARPDMEVAVVESRRRRVEWLESVITRNKLSKCRVIAARLEDVESFPVDVISARAFAPLDKLLRLSARFSTPDTVWLLPKGRTAEKELQEQPKRIAAMFHVEQSRTDPASGILVGRGAPQIR